MRGWARVTISQPCVTMLDGLRIVIGPYLNIQRRPSIVFFIRTTNASYQVGCDGWIYTDFWITPVKSGLNTAKLPIKTGTCSE